MKRMSGLMLKRRSTSNSVDLDGLEENDGAADASNGFRRGHSRSRSEGNELIKEVEDEENSEAEDGAQFVYARRHRSSVSLQINEY